MRKYQLHPKLDAFGIKTGIELTVGGILALLLMRWFGLIPYPTTPLTKRLM